MGIGCESRLVVHIMGFLHVQIAYTYFGVNIFSFS